MQFFTRPWALGKLTDGEYESALTDYRDFLASLDPDGSVRQFADSISLNDAWIDIFKVKADVISLVLLTGDLQRGYWWTSLKYSEARIASGEEALLEAVRHRPTEIWYDEFAGTRHKMHHRFMLVEPHSTMSLGEFQIDFRDFAFSEIPADGRVLPVR
jgi:hypothetical protein